MTLHSGERQVAPTVDCIRRDHVARYEWAAKRVALYAENSPKQPQILDVGCGVGYGTKLLASAGCWVWGIDCDEETVAYAREHYRSPRASYSVSDVSRPGWWDERWAHDAAVCFEMIEHIADPLSMLTEIRAPLLLASVPNEEKFPYRGYKFHHRHYTRTQFEQLLNRAGWKVIEWWGQEGTESDVVRDVDGRTLIAVCELTNVMTAADEEANDAFAGRAPSADIAVAEQSVPAHVAILALGPSLELYSKLAKTLGGRHKFCDEVWTINAVADLYQCDRVFHMDDVRIQEIRVAAAPDSNIAAMLQWLKRHPGPVYTSRTHPDYPGLVEYPLQDVINDVGFAYFNSTAAAAVAYAIHIGVKKISLFGFDFTYANSHHAEKGRANVEFMLGIAAARGIKLSIPRQSSLMDACASQDERLYGYDTLNVKLEPKDGVVEVVFTEKTVLPTAEEIEHRYDHTRHPSLLVDP